MESKEQANQEVLESKVTELPANAYSELEPGEEYKPVLPADKPATEVTGYSLIMGVLMAIIFSAATAYSGLKIGQVFEAAIPIAIIAVGVSAALRKKNALGQNVIIQSALHQGLLLQEPFSLSPASIFFRQNIPRLRLISGRYSSPPY